jgi:diazepam-binding inhibitor (GABA receptor modulating acyl-CoA-binding protein)
MYYPPNQYYQSYQQQNQYGQQQNQYAQQHMVQQTVQQPNLNVLVNQWIEVLRPLLPRMNHEQMLRMYGLYKQFMDGDCTGDRPSIFNVKGRAKFDAWMKNRGMTKERAMQLYIQSAQSIYHQLSQ